MRFTLPGALSKQFGKDLPFLLLSHISHQLGILFNSPLTPRNFFILIIPVSGLILTAATRKNAKEPTSSDTTYISLELATVRDPRYGQRRVTWTVDFVSSLRSRKKPSFLSAEQIDQKTVVSDFSMPGREMGN